jgi:hypothetical protein
LVPFINGFHIQIIDYILTLRGIAKGKLFLIMLCNFPADHFKGTVKKMVLFGESLGKNGNSRREPPFGMLALKFSPLSKGADILQD